MYQALATATYVLNMLFIKLSIGFFLLRLSTSMVYNWIIYVSLAIITVWSTVIFFWNIFQCSPVEAQWDYTILNSQCVSPNAVVAAAYSISVMTILSDWLYALIPIPLIWNVKMSKQAKATVIVILGLGIFASIATLIRLKFLADLSDLSDILCRLSIQPRTWMRGASISRPRIDYADLAYSHGNRRHGVDSCRTGRRNRRIESCYHPTSPPSLATQWIHIYRPNAGNEQHERGHEIRAHEIGNNKVGAPPAWV
ncbi:integral membrane family protein [Colletotrichum chrysophilum]|uniref:Integral membrane family protein n=1 Tax=Colletotrichum chrysophilum TaxID=1836956 RepID=A0AAD9ECY2_9PEZI|nr:integral membrane family protein [Colletotrichum chrysophilum]